MIHFHKGCLPKYNSFATLCAGGGVVGILFRGVPVGREWLIQGLTENFYYKPLADHVHPPTPAFGILHENRAPCL